MEEKEYTVEAEITVAVPLTVTAKSEEEAIDNARKALYHKSLDKYGEICNIKYEIQDINTI